MKRVHLIISGRVQGVFFRARTRDEARLLGLKGWVRNTHDGKVEATAEGPEEKLEQFIGFCKKGPTGAHVSNVKLNHEPYSGEFKGFEIKYQ